MATNYSTNIADSDPLWYKDAVIYEVHVRAFYDSDEDGMGDFRGLTKKLDYLQDLGITAIWLLPFFPSPWRDDGYDISDYNDVHPAYGTLRDFQSLADFDSDLQRFFYRHRPFTQAVGQRLAFEIFHHQEINAILVADIVQGANSRMIEG